MDRVGVARRDDRFEPAQWAWGVTDGSAGSCGEILDSGTAIYADWQMFPPMDGVLHTRGRPSQRVKNRGPYSMVPWSRWGGEGQIHWDRRALELSCDAKLSIDP
jgi:hypothetical protein